MVEKGSPAKTSAAIQRQSYVLKMQAAFRERPLRLMTGMHFGEQTGYVSWRVPSSIATLEILHITDVQFGHVLCKTARVKEYRDWVLSQPNRFMVWGGDMIDAFAAYRGGPGEPWENACNPHGQIMQFCEMWAPARHRVLGYVGGNHERRGIASFGDLGLLIASLLDIPYAGGQQRVDIWHGDHKPFKINLWHGTGTAKTAGAKMQMLDRYMRQGDGQLYLVGHLHDSMMKARWHEVRDEANAKVKHKKVIGAMSSSFLEYSFSYAEARGLDPSGLMMARAVLEANGKWEVTFR